MCDASNLEASRRRMSTSDYDEARYCISKAFPVGKFGEEGFERRRLCTSEQDANENKDSGLFRSILRDHRP